MKNPWTSQDAEPQETEQHLQATALPHSRRPCGLIRAGLGSRRPVRRFYAAPQHYAHAEGCWFHLSTVYRSLQRLCASMTAERHGQSSEAALHALPRRLVIHFSDRSCAPQRLSLKPLDILVALAKRPQGEVLHASAMCSVQCRAVQGNDKSLMHMQPP